LVQEWDLQNSSNPKAGPPQRDPLFLALGGISSEQHVLNTFLKIPASQLHDALLVLPFSTLPSLFTFISIWVKKQWEITLVCRILFFILKVHQKQIVASRELKMVLNDIRADLRMTLTEVKDVIGFNVAALNCIRDRVKQNSVATIEDVEDDIAFSGKKRTFVDVT